MSFDQKETQKIDIKERTLEASKKGTVPEKKAAYEELYKDIRTLALQPGGLSQELKSEFYTFLESYAGNVVYNQGTHGFQESACLMEMSFLLQLNDLKLVDDTYEWTKSSTLQELQENLGAHSGKSKLSDFLLQLNIHPDALYAAASGEQNIELLRKTLTRMTYSHQNIEGSGDYHFHKKYNDLTEAVYGGSTLNDLQLLNDYRYNRCSFMAGAKFDKLPSERDELTQMLSRVGVIEQKIKRDRILAQAQAYNPIAEAYGEIFKGRENDTLYLGKVSQIANMRGLMGLKALDFETTETPGPKHAEILSEAENHFRKALEVRGKILNATEESKNDFGNRFLYNNILTGLVHCLSLKPLTAESLEEAKKFELELRDFIGLLDKRQDGNTYRPKYENAIAKIEKMKQKVL